MTDVYECLLSKMEYVDGRLIWAKPHKSALLGKDVGRRDKNGYWRVHVTGTMVSAHRLIFFKFHRYIPDFVDHIDGDPSNNRIENLRAADRSGNSRNCKTPVTNKTGIKGVYWHGSAGRWTASIRINKKLTHLGTFQDVFSAACARRSAEITHYGEFAREI